MKTAELHIGLPVYVVGRVFGGNDDISKVQIVSYDAGPTVAVRLANSSVVFYERNHIYATYDEATKSGPAS